MNDFEKRIMNSYLDGPSEINEDGFLARLHGRVSESKDNRRTVMTSLCMLMVISLMTITQFGASDIQEDYLYDEDMETFFGTDFWTVNSDSLEYDESYFNDMAYFLLEEGYIWETYELINELEQEEEIKL